jgi:hypothetical protein
MSSFTVIQREVLGFSVMKASFTDEPRRIRLLVSPSKLAVRVTDGLGLDRLNLG